MRDLSDADVARLKVNPIVMDVATDAYGGDAEQVKRALDGELARVDKEVSTEETLLTGDPKEPFKEQTFGGDNRFELSFWRDRVQVDVGVRIEVTQTRNASDFAYVDCLEKRGIPLILT